MNKKILVVLSIFCLIISGIFTNGAINASEKENNIIYLTDKSNIKKSIKFIDGKQENTAKIEKINDLQEAQKIFSQAPDILWVDIELLNDNKYIPEIRKALEENIPVVFIGDQLQRNKIIDLLKIEIKEDEPYNMGDAVLKGIKIEKVLNTYLFTNIYIGKEESKDNEEIYNGLASTSYSSKLKTEVLTELNKSKNINSTNSIYATTPDTSGDYQYVAATGVSYNYYDILVELKIKKYKYNYNPVGNQYFYINLGDYLVYQKLGTTDGVDGYCTSYLYTYVSTPSGSTVYDYSPPSNTSVSKAVPFQLSLSYGGFGFSWTPEFKTKYLLDGGGLGSEFVQIKAIPKNWANSDYYINKYESINTVHAVEYRNSRGICAGSFTFTAVGRYNPVGGAPVHSDGVFY